MKPTWIRFMAVLAIMATLVSCDAFISAQQRVERARADLDAGKWGIAAIELRRAIQKEPNNPQAWLLLARLSLDAADASDALRDLGRATKAGAKGGELDALRVRAWLATDQPEALLDAASHHALAIPEPDLRIARARAYNELDEPQRALGLLEPIIGSHPALTQARIAAAVALAREDKLDDALKQLDTAMASDPKSSRAPLMKARLLESRGKLAGAQTAYHLALARMSRATSLVERATALAGLTETLLAEGRVAAATRSEAVLARIVPTAPATRLLGARLKLIHGHEIAGISELQSLLVDVPGDVEARLILGAAQLSQGSLQQAQQNLEQVVRATPDNIEARKLLATVHLKLHEPNEALQVLTPALGARTIDPQLLALFGTAAQRSNDPGAALAGLKDALRTHPDDTTLRLNLAQADLLANRSKDALDLLEATAAKGADEARRDGLLILAVNAVNGPIAASTRLEKLVRASPRNVRLLDIAAVFAASQGNLDRARSLLQQALAVAPHDKSSELALARVDLAAGKGAESVDLLRALLRSEPQNVAVRIVLANVLMHERSFAQAEHVLKAAERSHAGPGLPLALASVYLASGDLTKANALLDRATALDPQNAAIASDAGTLLMQANQYDAALARFRKATELAPNNPQYWLNVGRAQLALNQPLPAHDSFEKALQIEPQWLPAVAGLTLIDLRFKEYASALSRVRQYLAKHPGDPGGLSLEGEVNVAAGNLAGAASAFSEALKRRPEAALAVGLYQVRKAQHLPHPEEPLENWLALRPDDIAIRTLLGDYYVEEHSFREAANAFESVVKQSPSDTMALNNLAWVYNKLHDPRALTTAERAYALAPNTTEVLDTYAWILAHQGQLNRALPLITRAAKAGLRDPEIQYHYAYILNRAGHPGKARKVLVRLLASKQVFGSRDSARRLLARLKA